MLNDEKELKARVEKLIGELDSSLEPGAADYNALALAAVLGMVEFSELNAAEELIPRILGIYPDDCLQMLTNLRATNVLTEQGYHKEILDALHGQGADKGEDSGALLLLICNAAQGRMEYLADTELWKMTPAGKRYIEEKLESGSA